MLISGALPSLVALVLIWISPGAVRESPALRWTLTAVVLLAWLLLGALVRERLVDRLRTFANLVGGASRARLLAARIGRHARRSAGRDRAGAQRPRRRAARPATARA